MEKEKSIGTSLVGREFNRIRFGSSIETKEMKKYNICPECGVKKGQYHTNECVKELCLSNIIQDFYNYAEGILLDNLDNPIYSQFDNLFGLADSAMGEMVDDFEIERDCFDSLIDDKDKEIKKLKKQIRELKKINK
jgi:hypothetical protein